MWAVDGLLAAKQEANVSDSSRDFRQATQSAVAKVISLLVCLAVSTGKYLQPLRRIVVFLF